MVYFDLTELHITASVGNLTYKRHITAQTYDAREVERYNK